MLNRFGPTILWWSIVFGVIYALTWVFLIGTVPIPPATQTAQEVAQYFTENQTRVLWGAAINSWVGAFYLPFTLGLGVIMMRYERGFPILSMLSISAGVLQVIFLMFPPMLWGMAAYTPDRLPDVTAALHQIATLTLVTTDQVFIFQFVPLVILCLSRTAAKEGFPFSRLYGYFTLWCCSIYELSVFAYVTKTGVFAWNGLFVFWLPFITFGVWLTVTYPILFRTYKAIKDPN